MIAMGIVLLLSLPDQWVPQVGVKPSHYGRTSIAKMAASFIKQALSHFALPSNFVEPRCAMISISGTTIENGFKVRQAVFQNIRPGQRITLSSWLRSQRALNTLYIDTAFIPFLPKPIMLPANVHFSDGILWIDLDIYVPY